jgi:hypothetical protein
LVRRCLAKDPDARPASAEVFLEEFRRLRVFKVPPAASEQAGS